MTFSIIIPTYNGELFVEECILSTLNQHRMPDEIIVSDDNSTDRTLEICEKYVDKIKIFKNVNGPSGFVNGWNNAIAKASCDYISILHQDDVLDADFLTEMEKLAQENPNVLHLFSTCNYINEEGEIIGVSFPETDKVLRYTGLEYVKAYQNLGSPHIHRCPGVITHRSIFKEAQYNPAAGHIADDDFFYRVGQYTDVVGILKPLASYRMHKDSETGSLGNTALVKRLLDDYTFQVEQWKNSSFMDENAYSYFVHWACKYCKRLIIFSITRLDGKSFLYAIYRYCSIIRIKYKVE
jgi:glycosyltransferase involved in cell wall biosynthesis